MPTTCRKSCPPNLTYILSTNNSIILQMSLAVYLLSPFKSWNNFYTKVTPLLSWGPQAKLKNDHKSSQLKGSVIFYQEGGGLLKIGGDQVLCLRSKGGIKRFFQIKKGGSLIFFKEIKYFVKHSWNSCQFYRKGGLLILSLVGTLQNEVKSCNLGRVWIPYHQRT